METFLPVLIGQARPERVDEAVAHFERLVFRHALRVADIVEMDFEDVQSVYRVKAWQALLSFDPARFGGTVPHRSETTDCRCNRCKYVFSCLKNMEKDLLKKKRRGELFIDDISAPAGTTSNGSGGFGLQSRDHFESRYLAASSDEVYGAVEEEDVVIPSTLTGLERAIVVLLYRDHSQAEIRRRYGLERHEMDRTMRSIRLKFDDWRPAGAPAPAFPALAQAA